MKQQKEKDERQRKIQRMRESERKKREQMESDVNITAQMDMMASFEEHMF